MYILDFINEILLNFVKFIFTFIFIYIFITFWE